MNQKQIKSLGSKIKKAVRSKEGEEILDYYRMNLWTEGGCFALAHAIKKEYGGELFALVDPIKSKKSYAEHVVVKMGDLLLDADGAQDWNSLLDRWSGYQNSMGLQIMPLDRTITKDIECDQDAINEIRELLREKIGLTR